MVISTISEWNRKIQKKQNFRMDLFQLPSIQMDSTFIDVNTLSLIPGSISQLYGRGDRNYKKSNIERPRISKAVTNSENRGEPTKNNNTCPLCLQTTHHQIICKVF